MGFTHYYQLAQPISENDWAKIKVQMQTLIENSPVPLGDGWGEEGSKPDLTDNHININGIEDNAHETFTVYRLSTKWGFTKTARKPYDVVVVALLVLLHHDANLLVSSDGGYDDWVDGLNFLNKTLDANYTIPSLNSDEFDYG